MPTVRDYSDYYKNKFFRELEATSIIMKFFDDFEYEKVTSDPPFLFAYREGKENWKNYEKSKKETESFFKEIAEKKDKDLKMVVLYFEVDIRASKPNTTVEKRENPLDSFVTHLRSSKNLSFEESYNLYKNFLVLSTSIDSLNSVDCSYVDEASKYFEKRRANWLKLLQDEDLRKQLYNFLVNRGFIESSNIEDLEEIYQEEPQKFIDLIDNTYVKKEEFQYLYFPGILPAGVYSMGYTFKKKFLSIFFPETKVFYIFVDTPIIQEVKEGKVKELAEKYLDIDFYYRIDNSLDPEVLDVKLITESGDEIHLPFKFKMVPLGGEYVPKRV